MACFAFARRAQMRKMDSGMATLRLGQLIRITGFGFGSGSGLSADIDFEKVPLIINDLKNYIDYQCIPGGTNRNWDSYGDKIGGLSDYQKAILADPQTSGGLLVAVDPTAADDVKNILKQNGLEKFATPIGSLQKQTEKIIYIQA